jgi:hypothetical protein
VDGSVDVPWRFSRESEAGHGTRIVRKPDAHGVLYNLLDGSHADPDESVHDGVHVYVPSSGSSRLQMSWCA